MPKPAPHKPLLPHDRILALADAAVACGLGTHDAQDVLLAGLPLHYVGELPAAKVPHDRLVLVLLRMNQVRRLRDGTVPLAVWLASAVQHAAAHVEAEVFEQALADVTSGA